MELFHWMIIFFLSLISIAVIGPRLSALAEDIAYRTKLGQAIVGAVFLGATTSLPGLVTTTVAAWDDAASLAVSNGIGSIAVQTAFLALADLAYRRANLEHAAASAENILQCSLVIGLLALTLLAASGPDISIFHIHVVTPAMVLLYVFGIYLVYRTHRAPMWRPTITDETREEGDLDQAKQSRPLSTTILLFAMAAMVVSLAGFGLAQSGSAIAHQTPISESFVGTTMTGVATSLPELITTIAAVRQGALTLAVGNIVGGNAFDSLFVAVGDAAYTEGSLFHAIQPQETFLMALTIFLTVILMMGLTFREKHGFANIGFESLLMLIVYLLGVGAIATM